MRIRTAILTLVATMSLAGLVRAHGGHDHVRGTVTAVDATRIEVKTGYGKTISVALKPDTKYFKEKAAATAADVKVGIRVVIDADKEGENLTAKEVKIGVAAPAPEPAKQ
jgi:hypothetical protein